MNFFAAGAAPTGGCADGGCGDGWNFCAGGCGDDQSSTTWIHPDSSMHVGGGGDLVHQAGVLVPGLALDQEALRLSQVPSRLEVSVVEALVKVQA